MVEIAEIVDQESFEAWLRQEDLPRAAMVALANRSAMRVLPVFWAGYGLQKRGEKRDVQTVRVLRMLLTSASFARAEDADVRGKLAAAAASASAAAAASASAAYAASDFASATAAASDAATAATATDAATAASDASAASASASDATSDATADATWSALRADCHAVGNLADLLSKSLWPGHDNPLSEQWAQVTAAVPPDRDHPFAFWRDWYGRALDGTETRWPLLEHIALLDKDEDGTDLWENPEKLAAVIARLQKRRALNQTIAAHPHAWRIDLDHASGIFSAAPVERRDLQEVVDDVRQSIKDFHLRCRKIKVANFGQATELAFAPVIAILKRDLKKHRDAPYSLFKAIELARGEMEEIADAEGFAGESYISRFFKELDSHGEEVCLAAPEVVGQLKAKASLRYDISDLSRKRTLATQTLSLHLDSEGILKRTAFWALKVLQDPDASEADRKEAIYFSTSILPRAARAYLDDAAAHEEPAQRDPASRAKRFFEAADAISKLDKAKDALMELGTEVPQLAENVESIIKGLPL